MVVDGDDDHDDQASSKAMHFGAFQSDAFLAFHSEDLCRIMGI